MGRGTFDNCGSSLLYGPIHRDPEARLTPRARADRAFARYLQGALERGETSELHAFLCSSGAADMSRKKVPEADVYANWVKDLIIGKTPPSPGVVREHPSLLKHQAHAISLIARAGARLTPEVRDRLIGVFVTSDLSFGRGYELLEVHLDHLIRRTRFRRTSHPVVHQQALLGAGDRPQASHYKSSDAAERAACGRDIAALKMNWSDDTTGLVRPTCKSCQALGERGSRKILRREEDTAQLIRRRFEAIAEQARSRVTTMMSQAPVMGTEQFVDTARKEAWRGLVFVLAEICSEAGQPLDRAQFSRLKRLWSPDGDPEGSPGELPPVML